MAAACYPPGRMDGAAKLRELCARGYGPLPQPTPRRPPADCCGGGAPQLPKLPRLPLSARGAPLGTDFPPPLAPRGSTKSVAVTARQQAPAAGAPRRRSAPPPKLVADGQTSRKAYNSIAEAVVADLEVHLGRLTREHEGVRPAEATGVYVLLERCHSCEADHALTTRHDEDEYESRARGVLAYLQRLAQGAVLGAAEILCRLEAAPRCLGTSWELGHDIWHHSSRVGAFEVYLLTPQTAAEDPAAGGRELLLPPGALPPGPRAGPEEASNPSGLLTPRLVESGGSAGGEAGGGAQSWGAKLRLPCGYSATLLHSKLSANAWPGKGQLGRRFFAALPLGSISLHVGCPSAEPLQSFTVEVLAPLSAASSGDLASDGNPGGHSCVATGLGKDGLCNVRGVPLGTAVGVRIIHPLVNPKVIRFVTSRLRAMLTFGADVAFRLWTSEIPGGLLVYASDEGAAQEKLPEGVRPMLGEIEMATGEKVQVQGRVRMPWWGHCPDREGVVGLALPAEYGRLPLLGRDCSGAVAVELPSSRQLRNWLPKTVASATSVLESSPCRALLQDFHGAILALQDLAGRDSRPRPLELPAQEFAVFERLLENGCQFVEAYRNAALQHWHDAELGCASRGASPEWGDAAAVPPAEDQEAVLCEDGYAELAELCRGLEQSSAVAQARRELDKATRMQPHHTRGGRLAAGYLAAARTRPWLEALCGRLAASSGSRLITCDLKGSDGSTRAFERFVLAPEFGPPRDLARCTLRCRNMVQIQRTLEAFVVAFRDSQGEAALAGCLDRFQTAGRRGAVVLTVLWRGAGGPTAHVAEVVLAHEALRATSARSSSEAGQGEEARFLAEVRGSLAKTAHGEKEVETVEAFASLRRFWVRGYLPGELDPQVRHATMETLHRRGCLEVAMLAAPEVQLEVVMPGELVPLEGVRVQVESERKQGKTDLRGRCSMALRPGEKVLKMRHATLTTGWVEAHFSVSGASLHFQVQMPMVLSVWRVPVVVRGEVFAWEVWLAGGAAGGEMGEPFKGALLAARGGRMQVAEGRLALEAGPVAVLDSEAPSPGLEEGAEGRGHGTADPLEAFSLEPPFARRLSGPARATPRQEGAAAGQEWQPQLLGLRSEVPLPGLGEGGEVPAGSVLVCARTTCCGCGVPGVLVEHAPGAGSRGATPGTPSRATTAACTTGADGVCLLRGEAEGRGRCAVRAAHAALLGGEEEFAVCPGTAAVAQLPLFFDSCVHLFTVEELDGRKLVQAFAGGREPLAIPLGARPFVGRLSGEGGRDYVCPPPPSCSPGDAGAPLKSRPLSLQTSRLQPGEPCPVALLLGAEPREEGYQWCPMPLLAEAATGKCGLQLLLQDALTLGTLRPVATVIYVDGRRFTIVVEDCPTAAAAAEHVARELCLPEGVGPLALAVVEEGDSGASASKVLAAAEALQAFATLRVLCRLSVRITFGRSHVGVPDAKVQLIGPGGQATRGCTARAGECELLAPAGSHKVVATHSLLGGATEMKVDLQHVTESAAIVAPAGVYVFMLPPDEDAGRAPSLSVWLCTDSEQLPPEAQPIGGALHLGAGRRVDLDSSTLQWVPLQEEAAPEEGRGAGHAGRPPPPVLPAQRFDLDCVSEDFLWQADASGRLESVESWEALLEGPIRAGLLRVPVAARCHFVDGAAAPELQRLPAEEHASARDLAAALLTVYQPPSAAGWQPVTAGVADEAEDLKAQDLGVFLNERLLLDEDEVPPRSVVDLWPLAPLSVQVATQCCRTAVPGVAVRAAHKLLMNGRPWDGGVERHLYEGTTDRHGRCRLKASVGEHRVRLSHCLLAGCPDATEEGELSLGVALRLRAAREAALAVAAAPRLFVCTGRWPWARCGRRPSCTAPRPAARGACGCPCTATPPWPSCGRASPWSWPGRRRTSRCTPASPPKGAARTRWRTRSPCWRARSSRWASSRSSP